MRIAGLLAAAVLAAAQDPSVFRANTRAVEQ